jgi:thiamine pyrophosphate-dependent acetolactate synthase large subunit-like protein
MSLTLDRIEAMTSIASVASEDDLFISSLGALRADWWNHRPGGPAGPDLCFWPVALGSVTSTALGLALALPHRSVYALETDGSVLMNTGVFCTLAHQKPKNLTVIIFDNEMYESIGGIPSLTAFGCDLSEMARGAGCQNCETVRDAPSLKDAVDRFAHDDEFGLITAKVSSEVYPWPAKMRKPTDGVEDKYLFMRHIERTEGRVVHQVVTTEHRAPVK